MSAARHLARIADLPAPAAADRDCLARTLWGEARADGVVAMAAVAAVVVNRMRASAACLGRGQAALWWGGPDAGSVCRAPWQFACWSQGNPLRPRLLALEPDSADLAAARLVADAALEGRLGDPTRGADHYHLQIERPAWARGRRPLVVIGRHHFYRL